MSVQRALIRTGLGLAGFCAVATAVIGVAHTPWGRPLLKLPLLSSMASRAGCPVGAIEPADFERVRRTKLKGELGKDAAKARPALGFTLGQARRADVERWAQAKNASCKTGQVASVLECSDVQQGKAPTISRLRLQFDEQQRLVSVDLFRSASPDEALVARFNDLSEELAHNVGPATITLGDPTVRHMRSHPFQTVMRQYRYQDYVAKTTLVNLGRRGLKLREQYQWLQDTTPPA